MPTAFFSEQQLAKLAVLHLFVVQELAAQIGELHHADERIGDSNARGRSEQDCTVRETIAL